MKICKCKLPMSDMRGYCFKCNNHIMYPLTHGGKRKGAGRPQTKEPTKTIRVPVSLLPKIEQIIKRHKSKPLPAEGSDTVAEVREIYCFCANGGREGLHGICTNCGNHIARKSSEGQP